MSASCSSGERHEAGALGRRHRPRARALSRDRTAEDVRADDRVQLPPPEEERPASTPRSVARNAAVAYGGEIVAKASSVAFFAVMARELGEGRFGHFIFALSLTSVLVLAAGLGTDSLLEREVARDRSRARDYVRGVTGLKAVSAAGLLVLAGVMVNLADYPQEARLAVYLVGGGVLIEHLSKTRYAAFMAYEQMRHMSLSIIVQRTSTAIIGVVLLLAGFGLVAVSIVFLGGALLALAVAELSFRRLVRSAPSSAVRPLGWRTLIRAGLPIGVSGLLFTLLLKLDAVLVGFLAGGTDNAEVGYFGAAYRVVEATMFLSWYFGGAVMPWIARAGAGTAGDLARGYEIALKAVTAMLVPLAVTFAVLAGPIVGLLYGDGYEEAVLPLRLLSAMTLLYGVNYLASTFFIGRDRPGAFGRLLVVVVLQNILFNAALIPQYGAAGAAFNAALSGVLLALLGFRQASRVVGSVRTSRPFVSPVLAAAAMALAMLLAASLPVLSLLVGAVVYPAAFAAAERLLFPRDLDLWRRLLAVRTRSARAHAS
ncbi:MAG TPA: flippase [Solirubrobacteraceae bacterium]|nr:flippase [Solirubrobacteraceae bacterium]